MKSDQDIKTILLTLLDEIEDLRANQGVHSRILRNVEGISMADVLAAKQAERQTNAASYGTIRMRINELFSK